MNFEQIVEEIFNDYDNKHHDILCNVLATSEQIAKRILDKYNTKKLTADELERLKKLIVQREVGEFLVFVERNADILDAELTDNEKFKQLFARHDKPSLTEKERTLLKKRIRRHIYDNEVCKILADLADKLKKKDSL